MANGNYNFNNARYSGGFNNNYQQQNAGFRNNYGNGYSRNNNPQNYQPKKHSGCKMAESWFSKRDNKRVEEPYIRGWNFSKGAGMMSFIASPRQEKRATKNKNWENWAVKVTFQRTREVKWFNGLYDVNKKKLHLPDLGMIANPHAPNGGYFGKFFRTK